MERVFTCGVVSTTISKRVNKDDVLLDIVKSSYQFENKVFLTRAEIKESILQNYGIMLLDEEIKGVVEQEGAFAVHGDDYELVTNEINQNKEIDKHIEEIFSKSTPSQLEKIKETIYKYLYQLFYNQFESLIKSIPNLEKRIAISSLENSLNITQKMSKEEREIVNVFLEYESIEKNRLIYSIIKNAIDFIGVVGGKSIAFNQSSLINRTFFLDSNVLFRGIGLNGEDRKDAIESFMTIVGDKKLKSKMFVTNLTIDEFIETIKFLCKQIKADNIQKVRKEQVQFFDQNGVYSFYIKWKQTRKSDASIDNFEKWCIASMWTFISTHQIEVRDIEKPTNDEFIDAVSRFQYQANRHTISSAEIDLANVYYLRKLRNNVNDIRNASVFIITCDAHLITFCRQQDLLPSNMCFLPSFWLTLVMDFTGRVNDENALKCFTNFLKTRTNDSKLTDQEVLNIVSMVNDKIDDVATANVCVESVIQERIRQEMDGSISLSQDQVEEIVEIQVDKIKHDISKLIRKGKKDESYIQSLKNDIGVLSKDRETIDKLLFDMNEKEEKLFRFKKVISLSLVIILDSYFIYSLLSLVFPQFSCECIKPLHNYLVPAQDRMSDYIGILMVIIPALVTFLYTIIIKKSKVTLDKKIKENNIRYGK